MKLTRTIRNLAILAVILCNIGCDQVTKTVIRRNMGEYEQLSYLNNHFTITKTENTGAFLSLGDTLPLPVKLVVLSLLPLLVLGGATYFVITKTNISNVLALGICFVIGGGVGNLYDRIVHGSVTDFLHLDFVVFRTGIFNMADVSIMTGMALILCYTYLTKVKPADTYQTPPLE
ncbi:signal peptidase II [Hufsiella ginkgonis]|uniref:Lipoprotein signal peptidase n=1 Tax=Hufsiella ginkgonis TaxID=2695274 RepID=A0A7K1XZJ5_9SPHI|nr:signal peptidase II [Hufsiella ginkgonis]MXV16431.1 signal peptidase II [Hufsiella ginkgonis]